VISEKWSKCKGDETTPGAAAALYVKGKTIETEAGEEDVMIITSDFDSSVNGQTQGDNNVMVRLTDDNYYEQKIIKTTDDEDDDSNNILPYVKLIHPKTNCEVILLGCLHGSKSSADYVNEILTENVPQAVVLELCASRYKDVQRELLSSSSSSQKQQKQQKETRQDQNDIKSTPSSSAAVGEGYLKMVLRTIQQRGLSSGIAASILGGASKLQTLFSGFDPGLEFICAINYCASTQTQHYHQKQQLLQQQQQQQTSGGTKGKEESIAVVPCDIILADQEVGETLNRLGQIPQISLQNLWSTFRSDGNDNNNNNKKKKTMEDSIIWKQSNDLTSAIWGSSTENNNNNKKLIQSQQQSLSQIDMGKILTRNPPVRRDVISLTLPPLILVFSFIFILDYIFTNGNGAANSANTLQLHSTTQHILMSDASSSSFSMGEFLISHITSLFREFLILSLGYVLIALPASQVIITERDEILTSGISQACQYVVSSSSSLQEEEENNERNIVVAVLGLLHVNGVAKRLLQE